MIPRLHTLFFAISAILLLQLSSTECGRTSSSKDLKEEILPIDPLIVMGQNYRFLILNLKSSLLDRIHAQYFNYLETKQQQQDQQQGSGSDKIPTVDGQLCKITWFSSSNNKNCIKMTYKVSLAGAFFQMSKIDFDQHLKSGKYKFKIKGLGETKTFKLVRGEEALTSYPFKITRVTISNVISQDSPTQDGGYDESVEYTSGLNGPIHGMKKVKKITVYYEDKSRKQNQQQKQQQQLKQLDSSDLDSRSGNKKKKIHVSSDSSDDFEESDSDESDSEDEEEEEEYDQNQNGRNVHKRAAEKKYPIEISLYCHGRKLKTSHRYITLNAKSTSYELPIEAECGQPTISIGCYTIWDLFFWRARILFWTSRRDEHMRYILNGVSSTTSQPAGDLYSPHQLFNKKLEDASYVKSLWQLEKAQLDIQLSQPSLESS